MKFLIIKPSSLGDILHAFPAVRMISEKFPEAEIHWLVHPAFADILEYLPEVKRTIFFDRKKLGSAKHFTPAFGSLLKEIRRDRYEAVIDMQGLLRSAAIASLAKTKKIYGPYDPKEHIASVLYKKKISYPENVLHALERNSYMIADFLGEETPSFSYPMPVVEHNLESAKKLLLEAGMDIHSKFVAVTPGARWATKQWPSDFFADIVKQIADAEPELSFVLLGSKSEAPLAEKVIERAKQDKLPNKMIDLSGKTTLGDLTEIIRASAVLISNDSGPMHIAAILNVPVLAFFGPTSPELTGPYSATKTVLVPELDCIQCFKRYCDNKFCHSALDASLAAKEVLNMMKGS